MCDIFQTVKSELNEIENVTLPQSENTDLYVAATPNLLDLPIEVLFKICSFLDAKSVSSSLRSVCKRFEDIFADDELWKYWVFNKIKSEYPILPHLKLWEESDVEWENVYIEIDTERDKWCNGAGQMIHTVVNDVHFASVDAVLLVDEGRYCVSGGRDRSIALWATATLAAEGGRPRSLRPDAHSGWVWDLAAPAAHAAPTKVYSASWDNTVKAWDLSTDLVCTQTLKCGISALSVAVCDNFIFTGLYSKIVLLFDPRAGCAPVMSYKTHRGPVLALETRGRLVASVSEDRTMTVFDTVARRPLVTDVTVPFEKGYPVCLNWSPYALYIGDSKGVLHLLDPEKLCHVKSHRIWPAEGAGGLHKVTGCQQGAAALVLSSDKGEIRFMYNADPPQTFAAVHTATRDVTQMRYQSGVLVAGTCDSVVEFWTPAERAD